MIMTHSQVKDVASIEEQNQLVSKEHERAHRGINEVESQMKRSFFFPKLNHIKSAVNTCIVFNEHKCERKPYNIKISPRPITKKPMERVHMDIFSINSKSFHSIVCVAFSKFA